MGNPNPSPATRWKPGQSGNPAGYSRKRRLSDALAEAILSQQLEGPLIQTWLAMALGKKPKDRSPEYQWFRMLVEYLDGKVPETINTNEGQGIADAIRGLRDLGTAKKGKTGAAAKGRRAVRRKRAR